MRIAADARILELPRPTGVERSFGELLRALPRLLGEGDELLAYSRSAAVSAPPPSSGTPLRPLGGPGSIALWRETTLTRALERDGADVLWSPVGAIPLRTRVPCVATFHEAPWLVRPRMEGLVRERIHRVRLRIAARRAARIVCPSETSADQLTQLHPRARAVVRVVPHGVAGRFREPPEPESAACVRAAAGVPDRPYFLHVGGDRPRKDIGLLLGGYGRFREAGGRAGLELVGPGNAPSPLPPAAAFRGYVDEELLLALYAGALALVVSSESEGFGLPVLEAMACGTPVVATAAGALAEVAQGAAYLVEPGNAEALCRALIEVERDGVLRADLAGRGRERAASATWDDAAERLLEVLREAADTR